MNETTKEIPIPPIFPKTPLCHPLLTNKAYTFHPTIHSTLADPFFRKTARAHDAVRASAFLYRSVPDQNHNAEGHLLLHIGPGVCGQPGIAHGGFLATVMDEAFGTLIAVAMPGVEGDGEGEGDGGFKMGISTVGLEVRYVRAVRVPGDGDGDGEGESGCVIVATARVKKVEGRKVFVEGVIRDEGGHVCTLAEAVFVKTKPNL